MKGTNQFLKLFKWELVNVARNRWVFALAVLVLVLAETFIRMAGDFGKALTSLTSVTIVLVPLAAALFSNFYWYSSERATELLLTQPLRRGALFWARFLAIVLALGASFAIGTSLPFIIHGDPSPGWLVLAAVGAFLCVVFTAIGSFFAVVVTDRMKGVGLVLGLWLYLVIVHDGLILLALLGCADYPMDVPGALLGSLNPIGLSRLALLVQQDAALLLGHTGALMARLLTGTTGWLIGGLLALAWMAAPAALGLRRFLRRDF
jgi:Cu-processing system permease protein